METNYDQQLAEWMERTRLPEGVESSPYWRVVLVLPFDGALRHVVTVHQHVRPDGTELYAVRGDVGQHATCTEAHKAFSKAFELAAWGVRARKATAADYR